MGLREQEAIQGLEQQAASDRQAIRYPDYLRVQHAHDEDSGGAKAG